MEDEIKLAAKGKSWGSLQAHRDMHWWRVRVCLCERAGASEREEALKVKLLLQLCICSESLYDSH